MSNSQSPKPRKTPAEIAAMVELCVRSFVQILYWVLIAVIAAATGSVVLAAIWWALQQVRTALGF